MKKWLAIGGIGLAGFGLYRYFKYQVNLALNYDYNIKNFSVLGVVGDNINVAVEFDITNNSNFEVMLNSYELEFYYLDQKIGTTISNVPVKILPNSKISIKATGTIDAKGIKQSALSFMANVLARKPIIIQIKGNMKVKFLGVNSTLNFDKENFQYSADLIKDSGLDKLAKNFKAKNPKISDFLGLK